MAPFGQYSPTKGADGGRAGLRKRLAAAAAAQREAEAAKASAKSRAAAAKPPPKKPPQLAGEGLRNTAGWRLPNASLQTAAARLSKPVAGRKRPRGESAAAAAAPSASSAAASFVSSASPASSSSSAAPAPAGPPPPVTAAATLQRVAPAVLHALQPHQLTALAFVWDALRTPCAPSSAPAPAPADPGGGCVLADEMGLGKTLTALAAAWAVLHRDARATCRDKAVVVCPASLVRTWRAEFRKWLGPPAWHAFAAADSATDGALDAFLKSSADDAPGGQGLAGKPRILAVSFEVYLRRADALNACGDISIVVVDEAHRLKNSDKGAAGGDGAGGTATLRALRASGAARRLLLTGTPLQNDLTELWALMDFAAPGCLGSAAAFGADVLKPLLAARAADCDAAARAAGVAAAAALRRTLAARMLRRRARAVLRRALPARRELVVLCAATPRQRDAYAAALRNTAASSTLAVMSRLRQVCNHPAIRNKAEGAAAAAAAGVEDAYAVAESGKLAALVGLLAEISARTDEKVVVVSSSTRALDAVGAAVAAARWPCVRLDGSTPPPQRQALVAAFNAAPRHAHGGGGGGAGGTGGTGAAAFAFLLSARAGGVGLTLTGASRLVMYDLDWNPAVDLQAMGRVYRMGQPRPVWIYRLLTAGTFEEDVYTRQQAKLELADVSDGVGGDDADALASRFTPEDLKAMLVPVEDRPPGDWPAWAGPAAVGDPVLAAAAAAAAAAAGGICNVVEVVGEGGESDGDEEAAAAEEATAKERAAAAALRGGEALARIKKAREDKAAGKDGREYAKRW